MRFPLKSFFSIHPASLTLCTIVLVVMLFLSSTPILDLIELKTYDLRFLSRGHMQPSPAVVLALIDEKSLNTEGRWPWPRSKLAALVDILAQDGARGNTAKVAFQLVVGPRQPRYLIAVEQAGPIAPADRVEVTAKRL